jgi:hypothetical protein
VCAYRAPLKARRKMSGRFVIIVEPFEFRTIDRWRHERLFPFFQRISDDATISPYQITAALPEIRAFNDGNNAPEPIR